MQRNLYHPKNFGRFEKRTPRAFDKFNTRLDHKHCMISFFGLRLSNILYVVVNMCMRNERHCCLLKGVEFGVNSLGKAAILRNLLMRCTRYTNIRQEGICSCCLISLIQMLWFSVTSYINIVAFKRRVNEHGPHSRIASSKSR